MTDVFQELGKEVAAALGDPDLPTSVIAHPIGGLTPPEGDARGAAVPDDVIARLMAPHVRTRAIAAEETSGALDLSGSWEEINDYFHARAWTDGLPIVPCVVAGACAGGPAL